MQNFENKISSILNSQKQCIDSLLDSELSSLENILKSLLDARNNNNRIFVMGNGGSGSTASHFVSDLLKTALVENKNRFSAISLVDNVPVLLAWSNDSSYDDIFVEQLKNHLSENDIVIGFSGSGNSNNILNAFNYGKTSGALCIGITGMGGGNIKNICDISLIVPSNDMLTIESMHLMICHCLISLIRDTGNPLFKYE
jgi:D-sedoheptulose 7-phosphate isomerase